VEILGRVSENDARRLKISSNPMVSFVRREKPNGSVSIL